MTEGPRTVTTGLKAGDVVAVAQLLTPRDGGNDYWWRTFRVVTKVHSSRFAALLILKLHPDMDKDLRLVDFGENPSKMVITQLPEPFPQGVAALYMKALHKGWFKPGEDA